MWSRRCRVLAASGSLLGTCLLTETPLIPKLPVKPLLLETKAPHVEQARTQDIAATQWLKLQTLTYRDQTGHERKWDLVTRTTRTDRAGVDAVIILPLLRSSKKSEVDVLLVQQFRPPVAGYTVELPAGLIDAGESSDQAAVRELKEETGYTGRVLRTSGPLTMSPGLSDETVKLVVVEVDLDIPENRQPKPQPEEGEFIQVMRVPLKSLSQELTKLQKRGVMPISGGVK
ncbi:unnamed protein product [Effrenium voratum]|uniref:Nudix hydrolase domain-containing protein n=1 Tax=Effrenium voratum TaxID=2562239 RepID=A0AA36MRP2_9DINO|nr:unnamed protein product [Effrenium voratum]